MPLRVPLVFHFNQHLTEFARVASYVCYRGLLRVLRAHPQLPVNIHISGTLIHALQWLDPEPLELIRDGIAAGQFELLGSTYAQNVPYVSDDWDNARQMELHRQVLHDTFGASPTVFWNPGRCWRQSLVPLIAGAGYESTLVEDRILDAAGLPEAIVAATTHDGHDLVVVHDDEALRHRFNFAAWFDQPGQLREYLHAAATKADEAQHWRAYCENAEAMGLWAWQAGVVPHYTWGNLDRLLTRLERDKSVDIVHLSQLLEPAAAASLIPDGSGAWMDAALARPDAPQHEDGYDNWFDFIQRAPRFGRFSRMYGRLRQRLGEPFDGAPDAARALHQLALHTYLAHQHEFGCVGVGGSGYRGWEGARAALAAIRASDFASEPQPFLRVEDVTGEGYDEILMCDGRDLVVLAPGGGRLLYWFDLLTGCEFVGNQLAVFDDEYSGDAAFPERETLWKPWLPDTWDPQADIPDVEMEAQTPPSRMGCYLPDWIWTDEVDDIILPTRETEFWEEIEPLKAQRRALADHISVDGSALCDPDDTLDYRFDGDQDEDPAVRAVVFIRHLEPDITLRKRFTLSGGSICVRYSFRSRDDEDHAIELATTHELCPDYAAVVRHGRDALRFDEEGETVGVQNSITERAVLISADQQWVDMTQERALLALEVGLTFELEVAAGAETDLVLTLTRT